jgi:hypothetical protein
MANKHIDLFKEIIPLVDLGVRTAWSEASEDERKEIKGDMYNLNRYISSVKTNNRDIQEHFILTVNEYYNKHWSVLQQHPNLLWQLLCMCSHESKKTFFHEWIPNKKRDSKGGKRAKFLEELMPDRKTDEIELLAELSTDKEIKDLARSYGMDEATIAKKLK